MNKSYMFSYREGPEILIGRNKFYDWPEGNKVPLGFPQVKPTVCATVKGMTWKTDVQSVKL